MTTLTEIETAIRQLPEHEIRTLLTRLHIYLDDAWDEQLTSDLNNGKLDHLIAKAEGQIGAHEVKDLHEIINNT